MCSVEYIVVIMPVVYIVVYNLLCNIIVYTVHNTCTCIIHVSVFVFTDF